MVNPFPSSLAVQERIPSDRLNADPAAVGRAPVTMRPPMPTDNATRGYAVGDLWMFGGNLWRAGQVSAETASWAAVIDGTRPPLDAVGGAAPVAAYGTRRLRAAYTGEALNVVRASDSTAIDIGFGADGSLDTPRLDAFLGNTTGRIVVWYDQSGAGNNATQDVAANQPAVSAANLLGNTRSIVFDTDNNRGGPTRTLAIPAAATGSAHTTSVFTLARVTASARQCVVSSLHDSSAPNFPVQLYFDPSSGMMSVHGFVVNSGLYAGNQPTVIGHINAATGTTIVLNNRSATGAGAANQTLAGGTLGRTPAAKICSGNVEIAAWVWYNRALSATEQMNLQGSLTLQFATQPQVRDMVVFAGDSITEIGLSTCLRSTPRIVGDQLCLPVNVVNAGYWGQTIGYQIANFDVFVARQFCPTASNNVALLAAGTNDIVCSGLTGEQTWAAAQKWLALARASGFTCLVASILPRRTSNTALSEIATFNDMVRTQAVRRGFAGVIDVAADPTMGAPAAAYDATLYGDGTHPTDRGYSYLAPIYAAALNEVLIL